MTTLHAGSATDAGRVRSANQDVALVDGNLVAVADGMGGHAGGEVASRVAIDALRSNFTIGKGPSGLVDAAKRANAAVHDRAEKDRSLRGMGTTLTAAALVDDRGHNRIAIINVGDSRAYLFERGRLLRLTEDHSLVEEMLRRGELTSEDAATHPQRNILTRVIGIDSDVDVDTWVLEPGTETRLLLCSDGLTNECGDEEIASVLTEERDPQSAADVLVERALSHGGADNVTVVVADVERGEDEDEALEGAENATTITKASDQAIHVEHRPNRGPSEPMITARVVGFVLVLLVILVGIGGFTVWFNNATYFVGLDQNHLAIYEGRPGGLLMFHPTLIRETQVTTNDVLASNLPELRSGMLESSYDQAKTVVADLASEKQLLGGNVATSPSTTVPPPTTTTKPSVAPTSKAPTTTTAKSH